MKIQINTDNHKMTDIPTFKLTLYRRILQELYGLKKIVMIAIPVVYFSCDFGET